MIGYFRRIMSKHDKNISQKDTFRIFNQMD